MNTIAAISTAPGIGGIAIIRVSGIESIPLVDTLFHGRIHLTDAKAATAHYGNIERGGELLDEVVCTIYRSPHSFTGEDTVEIACHGSRYVQDTLMQWLIDSGARQAGPGEFARRAFMNGRIDLSQAEAIADLIAAQSKAEKELALQQLKGGIRSEIQSMRDSLLTFTSLLELELDFADHEELEFADRSELQLLIQQVLDRLQALIQSFRTGNAIRNGVPVAIVGPTNAGKSTLLNALVGEERAIVSDIHGTTRDTIEDVVYIDGIQFRLIDTAGMRDTNDLVEQLGIERSKQAMEKASIVVHLTAADQTDTTSDISTTDSQKHLFVRNKADLLDADSTRDSRYIYVSAKQKEVAPLRQALVQAAGLKNTEGVMVSNMRHYEALVRAHEALIRVENGMRDGLSGELLSLDLQDCLTALGEITGQITSGEVLSNIFSKFCIGK